MATTTTNFGWDIPQSTDLVKDGATAIAALGQDIDTAFVDFKGGTTGQVLKKSSATDLDVEWGTASSGLTLLNTTTVSGSVSSQSINSVFTSTYENYLIVASLVGTTVEAFNMRLRASGTDNTSSNYFTTGLDFDTGTATISVRNGDPQTSFRVGTIGSDFSIFNINVAGPQTSAKTAYSSTSGAGNAGNNGFAMFCGGNFNGTTSFDGFTLLGASNFTGTIRTYGLAN
jgi:hypothetical protein